MSTIKWIEKRKTSKFNHSPTSTFELLEKMSIFSGSVLLGSILTMFFFRGWPPKPQSPIKECEAVFVKLYFICQSLELGTLGFDTFLTPNTKFRNLPQILNAASVKQRIAFKNPQQYWNLNNKTIFIMHEVLLENKHQVK